MAFNLGIDPRRGDQNVRGAVTLPHGTGRTVRVGVFAEEGAAELARSAGEPPPATALLLSCCHSRAVRDGPFGDPKICRVLMPLYAILLNTVYGASGRQAPAQLLRLGSRGAVRCPSPQKSCSRHARCWSTHP